MAKPSDSTWFSTVQAPLEVDSADAVSWDDSADLVVVGFGGAGACAALEGLEQGGSVIVVDRFEGGGATELSGGIVYLGGGTPYQKQAGYEDTPDEMYRYLQMEAQGIVQDETLRRFCEDSRGNLQWLEQHGVRFEGSLSPVKTSYPTDKYYLYYSGNEAVAEYAEQAKPAPRGHRAVGKGLSGAAFYHPLADSAISCGARPVFHAEARRLIQDASGAVIGVEVMQMPAGSAAERRHKRLIKAIMATRTYLAPLAGSLRKRIARLEAEFAVPRRIRAHKGVVISTGGFVFNRRMVAHYAPRYIKALPLGNTGCNGSGIRLGQSAGGKVDHMERVSAWRFINPPMAWAQGIVVNARGERYCNEQVYGAKLGAHMVEEQDGRAILIIDSKLRRETLRQILPPGKIWAFQMLPALLNIFLNAKKAATIEGLAVKLGMDLRTLKFTVDEYNRAARGQQQDAFRKSKEFLATLDEGPFYAMDVSVDSQLFPCPTITLGGLVVDESSGQVRREDGSAIPGLYGAGRAAVGVASRYYVSGLSIADCVFSGRRAARAAVSG